MTDVGSDGQLLTADQGTLLVFVRRLPAPVSRVWALLTEPEQLRTWFGEVTGDPSTGVAQLRMNEAGEAPPSEVRIELCDPPHELRVQTASPGGSWLLHLMLAEVADGTELTFIHELSEPVDASSIGPGWHYYLDVFGDAVSATGHHRDWADYWPALSARYATAP